jgi:hypothetical protein
VKGFTLIMHYLKLPSGLLQVGDQMDLVIHWPKNKVAYPQARSLETQDKCLSKGESLH